MITPTDISAPPLPPAGRYVLSALLQSACEEVLSGAAASHPTRHAGLLEWSRRFLPHYFRLPASPMHVWLADELDRATHERGAKLNLIGPRASAKSTVATLAYVLRSALDGTERYIWILSDTRHQAAVHLENIRVELQENLALRRAYRRAFRRPPHCSGHVIRLDNGTIIESYGTGQRIRGKRRRQHRPSLIVCDDLQNDDHIASAWRRERSRSWFQGTLLKAGARRTNVVNLATALHRDALAMELQRTPGWTSRVFKAIERWPKNMSLWAEWEDIYANVEDPNRLTAAWDFYQTHRDELHAGAELLWPEEENLYALMRMRVDGGRLAFEREKQGSPYDPSIYEWPEAYFDEHIWFTDWPNKLRVRVITLDPSKGKDSRNSDYSAYVVLGVDDQGMIFVEADMARRPTTQMVEDGVELVCQFRPQAFGVESNLFQELLGPHFLAEFTKRGMPSAQPLLITNNVNKQVRIRRLGPLLAQRRFRFKKPSPSTKLLVEQLKEFPIGDHDDGPDALEMAVRLAEEMLRPPPRETVMRILPSFY